MKYQNCFHHSIKAVTRLSAQLWSPHVFLQVHTIGATGPWIWFFWSLVSVHSAFSRICPVEFVRITSVWLFSRCQKLGEGIWKYVQIDGLFEKSAFSLILFSAVGELLAPCWLLINEEATE